MKLPGDAKTWDTVVLPVMAPKLCSGDRSPQSTVTWRIGLGLFAAAAMANVNAAGSPALDAWLAA